MKMEEVKMLVNEDLTVEEVQGCFVITPIEYLDFREGAEDLQIPFNDEGITFCFVRKEDVHLISVVLMHFRMISFLKWKMHLNILMQSGHILSQMVMNWYQPSVTYRKQREVMSCFVKDTPMK